MRLSEVEYMNFAGAIFALERGHKVKRHHWSGYWYLAPADAVQTIMMHTYDGKEIDIRQTSDIIYTLSNCACDDWEIVEDWKLSHFREVKTNDT